MPGGGAGSNVSDRILFLDALGVSNPGGTKELCAPGAGSRDRSRLHELSALKGVFTSFLSNL